MAMMSNWRMLSIRSDRLAIFLMDDRPPSMITAAHPPGVPSIPATHDTADRLMWTPDNMRFRWRAGARPGRSSYRLARGARPASFTLAHANGIPTKRQLRFAGVREKFSGWGYDRAKALRPF